MTKQDLTQFKSDNTGNPAVYVGTYGKYNGGSIYGMWFDLTTFADYDEFVEACKVLHSDEADPEFMFQDYEYFPKELYCESMIDEETFDKIIAYANCTDKDKADAFISLFGADAFEDEDSVNENYFGYFDSYYDLGVQCAESCLDIPAELEPYFDYERYGRDCAYDLNEMDGYYWWN